MQKLKAGALQLVIFVIVVIAILLASFVLLVHVQKQFRINSDHTIESVSLVDRGFSELLLKRSDNRDTISVYLGDENYKSLEIYSDYWGILEKGYSKARIKNKMLNRVALIGASLDTSNDPALFLNDNNKPLVLVGNTSIKGKTYLPKRGAKSGNIGGQSYNGDQYIYGQTKESKDPPKFKVSFLNYLESLKDATHISKNANNINLDVSRTFQNSFKNKFQIAFNPSEIHLVDISITGHIIIQSRTKIIVESSAKLNDVLLIAPIIEIKKDVVGVFQAIATELIDVGKNVHMEFPSALVLQNDYQKLENGKRYMISIADNSKISGQVLVIGNTQPYNNDVQLKISAKSLIEGQIYCEQNLELRGTVYGSVYTDNFIIKEGGSVYQNHLFNAIIDSEKLNPEFIGLNHGTSQKRIAKWLY